MHVVAGGLGCSGSDAQWNLVNEYRDCRPIADQWSCVTTKCARSSAGTRATSNEGTSRVDAAECQCVCRIVCCCCATQLLAGASGICEGMWQCAGVRLFNLLCLHLVSVMVSVRTSPVSKTDNNLPPAVTGAVITINYDIGTGVQYRATGLEQPNRILVRVGRRDIASRGTWSRDDTVSNPGAAQPQSSPQPQLNNKD